MEFQNQYYPECYINPCVFSTTICVCNPISPHIDRASVVQSIEISTQIPLCTRHYHIIDTGLASSATLSPI